MWRRYDRIFFVSWWETKNFKHKNTSKQYVDGSSLHNSLLGFLLFLFFLLFSLFPLLLVLFVVDTSIYTTNSGPRQIWTRNNLKRFTVKITLLLWLRSHFVNFVNYEVLIDLLSKQTNFFDQCWYAASSYFYPFSQKMKE